MFEVNKLNVFYGKKQVLFDTSFSISENEKVLLIGPNGAGKSTLIKAAIGLLPVHSGDIRLNGNDISSWHTHRRISSGIGYLLQSENIVPGLTVEENLMLGGHPLKKHLVNERIGAITDAFKFLKDKLDKRAGLLSGGERQALAIGMVLMKKPRILFLDEPSAGLAPKAASDIIGKIKNLQSAMEIKAICMIEHSLKLALPWATKVVILVGGRVVHITDNPKQYLDNPEKLEKFYFSNN
jgi:branched-chain amino acid transport system ATP-binding protein